MRWRGSKGLQGLAWCLPLGDKEDPQRSAEQVQDHQEPGRHLPPWHCHPSEQMGPTTCGKKGTQGGGAVVGVGMAEADTGRTAPNRASSPGRRLPQHLSAPRPEHNPTP